MFGKGRPSQPFLSLCPHHYPVLTPIVSGESVLFTEGKRVKVCLSPREESGTVTVPVSFYALLLLESPVCQGPGKYMPARHSCCQADMVL